MDNGHYYLYFKGHKLIIGRTTIIIIISIRLSLRHNIIGNTL